MSDTLLYTLTAVWIVASLLWINRQRISHRWLVANQQRNLDRLGLAQLQNIKIPNGLDGCFKIDRLILLPDSILFLMQRDYPGRIYAAEGIEEWTQVLRNGSFKFRNPLFELDQQVRALQNLLPKVRIVSAVYFDLHSEFPKGRPHRVLQADDIPQQYRHRNQQVEKSVLVAWQFLQDWLNEHGDSCEILESP